MNKTGQDKYYLRLELNNIYYPAWERIGLITTLILNFVVPLVLAFWLSGDMDLFFVSCLIIGLTVIGFIMFIGGYLILKKIFKKNNGVNRR